MMEPIIRSLNPAAKPYIPVKEGFGYMGVILWNSMSDQVQCHICGWWFGHLGKHLVSMHKINSRKYKTKFGLQQSCGLQSKERKKNLIAFGYKAQRFTSKDSLKRIEHARSFLKPKHYKHFRSNAAFQNKYRLSEDHLHERYKEVMKIVRREPSIAECEMHDSALVPLIKRRWKTMNEFRLRYGYAVNPYTTWTRGQIVNVLRQFAKDNGFLPRGKHFKPPVRPSDVTIRTRFGSWKKALEAAGLRASNG